MTVKCSVCGNENQDDALYCAVCQNVFRKEGAPKQSPPAGPAPEITLDPEPRPAGPPTAPPAARPRPVPALPPEKPGMGDLLFEKRTPLYVRLLWGVIGSGFTALGLGGLGVNDLNPIGPLIGLAIGLGMLFAAVQAWVSVLSCYENGIRHRGLFGEAVLRYRDVGAFTWNATAMETEGIYTTTTYIFEFAPLPGVNSRPIRFTTVLRNEDPALTELRDHISRVIAMRMVDEFRRTARAQWTEGMCFLRAGLGYSPIGFLGRGELSLLPWNRIGDSEIENGFFTLCAAGGDKPVLRESVGQKNFFPGLYAMDILIQDALSPAK